MIEVWIESRLREQVDPDAGTLTRWDGAGDVVERRSLTAEESARFAPLPAPSEVPATVDVAEFEAGVAAVSSATTIAAMRSALTRALGAIRLS